jgi:hypothetical protein
MPEKIGISCGVIHIALFMPKKSGKFFAILFFAGVFLFPVIMQASVFSWGANTWAGGNPTNLTGITNTYTTSDGTVDVVVTVAETGGQVWTAGSVAVANSQTGGFTPVHNGLYVSINSTTGTSSYVQVSVKFVLHGTSTAVGVTGVSTNIFDIDAQNSGGNNYVDKIASVNSTLTSGSISATAPTLSFSGTGVADFTLNGSGTGQYALGILGAGHGGAGNDTSSVGNLGIAYSGTISQFSFQWSNDDATTPLGIQRITLDNIQFSRPTTPEMGSGFAAIIVCAGAVALHRRRFRSA